MTVSEYLAPINAENYTGKRHSESRDLTPDIWSVQKKQYNGICYKEQNLLVLLIHVSK